MDSVCTIPIVERTVKGTDRVTTFALTPHSYEMLPTLAETKPVDATLFDQYIRGIEMDPVLYDLIEPAVIFGTLLGTAFGVKLLVWGRGPIKRVRAAEDTPALTQRVAELEDQLEQSNEVIRHQAELLDDVVERVDFAERMLARHREEQPKGLGGPNAG